VTEQRSLFSASEMRGMYRTGVAAKHNADQPQGQMSLAMLQDWKQRVYEYQRQVRQCLTPQQQELFAQPSAQLDPDGIDPFQLQQQNTEFWTWKYSDAGSAALYFVIDYECSIVLYVGETAKSNRRWKGKHDCKDYLLRYREIHHQYQVPTALGTAFCSQVPSQTKARKGLETALIYKWRSPFNKENCSYWNTPFVQ
jgi:hypothetical protein